MSNLFTIECKSNPDFDVGQWFWSLEKARSWKPRCKAEEKYEYGDLVITEWVDDNTCIATHDFIEKAVE